MNQYIYLVLGVILGISIAVYYYESREEKIEKRIEVDRKIFSTDKLDETMETIVKEIGHSRNLLKRNLTEEEKNDIIIDCCKKNFKIELEKESVESNTDNI